MVFKFVRFIFLCVPFLSFGQEKPKLIMHYINDHGFPFGIDHLVLSSDGYYFFTASTENGCVLAKGKWKNKGKRLFLSGLDSTLAYPKLSLEFVKADTSKFATFKIVDYFKKPFRNFAVGMIEPNQKYLQDGPVFYADSSGQISVSKIEFVGFYLVYQFGNSTANLYDSTIQTYRFQKEVKQINISIDHPSPGALDRGIILVNLGNGSFRIRQDGLYQKKERVYVVRK